MSRTNSPLRLYLAAGAVALFAAGCGSANPNAPSLLSAASNTSQKGGASAAGKVDVCHRNDAGGFHLINISANALQAHLAHGDGQPNGGVPNSPLQIFGASCQVITLKKYTVNLASGAGGSAYGLDPATTYTMASGGSGTAVILLTHPAYASLPGARWVNWAIFTTGTPGWDLGFGKPHAGDDVTYKTGFTLPAGAVNASLSGSFAADNLGNGFLNGTSIGGSAAFSTPVAVGATTGFVPGANALTFKVQDFGGVAGLVYSVVVTYFAQ